MSFGRSTISPAPTMTGIRSSERLAIAVVGALRSIRDQSVHVLDRFQKVLLELLHHGPCRPHAVDQADALADKVADKVARLRVAGGRRAIDGIEGVAADD